MEKAYFKASKGLSDILLAEWENTQVKYKQMQTELIKEHSADVLYLHGEWIKGFGLKGGGHSDRKGFSRREEMIDGKLYTVFLPNKKFRVGKEFTKNLERLYAERGRNPSFTDYIVNKFNVSRMICGPHNASRTGMALFSSVSGFVKGVCVIAIPCDDKNPAPREIQGFDRIKKSEYIALTEE